MKAYDYHCSLMKIKIDINLKYFTIDTSDSNTSAANVHCTEPINPVTNYFFSNTDVILDSSPDKNIVYCG